MAAKKKAAKAKRTIKPRAKAAKPAGERKERKPRENTKLQTAEDMLRKGTTYTALTDALGWNNNTCRGVFARFRKEGKTITGTKNKGADTTWKMAA